MLSPLKLLQPIILTFACSGMCLAEDASVDTDCQCRDPNGSMRNLGTVECVNITGERYMVRCEMSTNTPYWRKLDESGGCPLA